MTTRYVERALFVIGDQNTGKSAQLRSMFVDSRLGNSGQVPISRNIKKAYAISNERWLYLRLMSPHEAGETIEKFLDKCAGAMPSNGALARRWNFAVPLQPIGTATLLGAPEVIAAFAKRFTPERIRVAILSPDCFGNLMPEVKLKSLTAACRKLSGTDVMLIDATDRTANGLIFSDFFDFT